MRTNVLVVITLMTACAEAGGSVEADDPVELQNAIAEDYCAHLEICGVAAPDFIYSSCTRMQLSEESARKLREDIDSGFAVWSREAAERCLQAIADDNCPIEPKLIQTGASAIDLDLDDAKACSGILDYRPPGPSSLH